MSALNETHIHKLTLRGSQKECDQVRRDLQALDWPSAKDESWIFVRKIEVVSAGKQLAQQVLQHTRHEVESGKQNNNVKRFASLTELLAALCNDLINGRQHWYWQRWQHLFQQSTSQALCTLLSEHISYLTSACNRLAQQHQLITLWQALQDEQAEQLLQQWLWHNNIQTSAIHFAVIKESQQQALFEWNGQVLQSSIWAPILKQFETPTPQHTLASCLLAQQVFPLALHKDPQQTLFFIQKTLNIGFTSTSTPKNKNAKPQDNSARQTLAPDYKKQSHSDTENTPEQFKPEDINAENQPQLSESPTTATTQTLSKSDITPSQTTNQYQIEPSSTKEQTTTNETSNLKQKPHPKHQLQIQETTTISNHTELETFHTQQGGVLYLLNFLNRDTIQTIMGDYWHEIPNGWAWLYGVARPLGFDHSDSLCDLFCQQLGLEKHQLDQLPPLPQWPSIEAHAQQWYANPTHNLWNASLLQLPARIQTSPSHIDLYTPLNQVRLEIRLAGLDINPGWLPWLGQVVNFHYETS